MPLTLVSSGFKVLATLVAAGSLGSSLVQAPGPVIPHGSGTVHLVFRFAPSGPLSSEQLQKTQGVLEKRLSILKDVHDGKVSIQAPDVIQVDLPGCLDANRARRILSSSGRLETYWAKNVKTSPSVKREYEVSPQGKSRFIDLTAKAEFGPESKNFQTMLEGWQQLTGGNQAQSFDVLQIGTSKWLTFSVDSKAAVDLSEWCNRYGRNGEMLAIMVDSRILSLARLSKGSSLGADFEVDVPRGLGSAEELSELLKAGPIPGNLVSVSMTLGS